MEQLQIKFIKQQGVSTMTKAQFNIGDRVAVDPDYRSKNEDAVFYNFLTVTKDYGMFWELEDGCLFCKSTNLEQGGVREIYPVDRDVLENNTLAVENNKMDSRKAAVINLLDAAHSPEMLEKILLEVSFIVFE